MTDKTIIPSGGTMEQPVDAASDRTVMLAAPVSATPLDANIPDGGDTLRTLRPEGGMNGSSFQQQDEAFDLGGDRYEKIKCLSDNSGEAQIFLVSRYGQEYVLKVYYPNFSVDKKLLQLIRSLRFEMIVELMDYGRTYVDGKSRYYELMEYLRGGTLQEYKLENDFNKFRRLALQGAAALAYCHHNGILHKDVKPSNFFFRDKEHTQLVLGDFGISSVMEKGARSLRTTQARTPIYAAPEMYADVIDGEVEITPAADFYSLGITLFSLWLGETPLSSNERVMMRHKNEGRLPRLNELPEKVKLIVQGLTAVNPQGRWGYDEVERWFKGEEVKVDISSPVLRYKTFVVDPDRNLVAENVHELVPLLLDNERLGMNYLYNGRIANWLESCGNQKLSVILRDITANKYPVQSRAGLMAAVYAMEPTYPYKDVQGNFCDDVHSMVLSLLANQEQYALKLQNPNDDLFLWLDVHAKCDMERLRSYFTPEADPHVAVMRLVYEVYTEIPFLARNPSGTLADIVHSFGYQSPTEDDWRSLCDGRMLSWMYSHEDMMACESLRILTQGQPYSETLAYKVLYNLDRHVGYDLREAKTPQAVGEVISHQLMLVQHLSPAELQKHMADVTDPDGRFCYYAQMHGWNNMIEEANRCFDFNSEENRERLGVYDLRTALYRFCRILGASPRYLLPDGTELRDPRNMPEELKPQIRSEMRNGALTQWMAAFYHEDPTCDFTEQYAYEHELVEWIKQLGRFDEHNQYFRRYTKAVDETRERVSGIGQQWNKLHLRELGMRYLFYALSALWLVLVLIFADSAYSYFLEHPYVSVLLPVGGMSAVIMGTRAYFKGFGTTMSALWGALATAVSLVPIYLLKMTTTPLLFAVGVIAITCAYMLVCRFTDFRKDQQIDSADLRSLLDANDVNTRLLDPLYYTFKTKSVRFNGSRFGMLDDADNQLHSLAGESVLHYTLWSVMVALLIAMLLVHCL